MHAPPGGAETWLPRPPCPARERDISCLERSAVAPRAGAGVREAHVEPCGLFHLQRHNCPAWGGRRAGSSRDAAWQRRARLDALLGLAK